MDIHFLSLTVCFEPPFWVGVFERIERGALSASRVTFGAEPKDCEVWDFVLKHYYQLKFSPSVAVAIRPEAVNPKRERRMLRKQTAPGRIGTKSQQALQLQRDASKQEQKMFTREQQEAKKQRRFALRQQKRKIPSTAQEQEGSLNRRRKMLRAWNVFAEQSICCFRF